MRGTLTIRNYRCFADSSPVQIEIGPGITAFLGINNSGKSSLIRLFTELRPYLWWIVHPSGSQMTSPFGGEPPPPHDLQDLSHDGNDRSLEVDLVAGRVALKIVPKSNRRAIINCTIGDKSLQLADGQGVQNDDAAKELLRSHQEFQLIAEILDSLYVPAFRTPFSSDSQTKHAAVPLGNAFIQDWDKRKRGTVKSDNRLVHRVTSDLAHLMGIENLEIDATQNRDNMTLRLNGSPYQLHEVGAGFSHCLMTLYYAAVTKPTYICIDEPETGLHPSLQIDFVNALGSYSTRGLWMATHNVGLARSIANDIYVARRLRDHSELMRWEEVPRLSALLGELSFSSYAALGGTVILLVEGPNEVRCYQQWLRLFGLDHQVIILPLGRAQMINGRRDQELAEVPRICSHVAAIIDRETDSKDEKVSQDRLQFLRSCENYGIRHCLLERRATENYLSERAVKAVDQLYTALGPYEKPTGRWLGKRDNWRIAREMTPDEIAGTDLGRFLIALGDFAVAQGSAAPRSDQAAPAPLQQQ